jgi:hypothetical protein
LIKVQAQNRKGDDITKRTGRFKGRVLMMKMGYYPNSSSIGSQIHFFLTMAAGAGALSVLALHLLDSVGSLIRRRKQTGDSSEKDGERQES